MICHFLTIFGDSGVHTANIASLPLRATGKKAKAKVKGSQKQHRREAHKAEFLYQQDKT